MAEDTAVGLGLRSGGGYVAWPRSSSLPSRGGHAPMRGIPAPGPGYLAGEFPGGVTSVDGIPTTATVRVLYRPEEGALGDGVLVAQVQSAPDGTWRVDGLDPALKFDVIARKVDYNDVIVAGVRPRPY